MPKIRAQEAVKGWRVSHARPSRNVAIGLTAALGGVVGLGMSGALAQSSEPVISCTATAVYGEPIDCFVGGIDEPQTSIDWSDGTITSSSITSYSPKSVGQITISLVDAAGGVLVSTEVQVTPDLELSCEIGDSATVFKLVANASNESGWDYVYTDLENRTSVYPGDSNYPAGFDLTGFERIATRDVFLTGRCSAVSQAGDDLNGDFTMTMTSEWEESRSVPFGYIVPWTSHHWAGTQPGELEATVSIDGAEASERIGIYFAGCG